MFDAIVLIFIAYSCIWNVLVFSFPMDETTSQYRNIEYFNYFVEFIFWADFVLTFVQAYRHKETQEVITDNKKIAINYFIGWFSIDFVSIFPFEIFLQDAGSAQVAKLARLARMPRLSKLINVARFKNILKAFEKKKTDNTTLLNMYMTLFYYNVFRLLLLAFIITYFLGCFWYWISLNQRQWFDDSSWIETTWYEEFSLGDMTMT